MVFRINATPTVKVLRDTALIQCVMDWHHFEDKVYLFYSIFKTEYLHLIRQSRLKSLGCQGEAECEMFPWT